jgi:hypothetical protein
MYVVFNSTVYPSTYHEIPDVLRWGQANIDRVHGLVFITYRTATTDDSVARDLGDRQVDLGKLSYTTQRFEEKFITGPEVVDIIQQHCPQFEPSGYLGGTILHDSFKWLAGAVIGSKKTVYGSIGKRTMEVAQAGHHLFKGTYLAYLSQSTIGNKVFAMAPYDPAVRKAAKARMADVTHNPSALMDRVYLQSIGIIQAPDLLPDGRADMCDSCPDITIYDGKFVNSCRMDEYRLFGGFVSVVEKNAEADAARAN